MSNPASLRGVRPADENVAVEIRPARGSEVEAAIRLLLSSPGGQSDEAQVGEFVRLATTQAAATGGVWVADQAGQLVSALLPVPSPGRTMLIFPPVQVQSEFHAQVTRRLIEETCRRAAGQGTHLVQALLDIHSVQGPPLLASCSFSRLAELLYLQVVVARNLREPSLPPDYGWQTYSPATHELFLRTIPATYQQSLDCPALNGLRDANDILAGHRATGQFDANLWSALCDGDRPVGVLLLNCVPQSDVIELVYLGLVPAHRGRGMGDVLMRRALAVVSASQYARLSLAVDAANLPALKLYWRYGLQAVGRKMAMFRDLRTAVAD